MQWHLRDRQRRLSAEGSRIEEQSEVGLLPIHLVSSCGLEKRASPSQHCAPFLKSCHNILILLDQKMLLPSAGKLS